MDKAKIMRLCNEIEDIATDIQERTMKNSCFMAQTIINKVLVIAAEITAQPKTNGDRIRQMTDEELVDAFGFSCKRCVYCNWKICDEASCRDGNLEWLKQEVSEPV